MVERAYWRHSVSHFVCAFFCMIALTAWFVSVWWLFNLQTSKSKRKYCCCSKRARCRRVIIFNQQSSLSIYYFGFNCSVNKGRIIRHPLEKEAKKARFRHTSTCFLIGQFHSTHTSQSTVCACVRALDYIRASGCGAVSIDSFQSIVKYRIAGQDSLRKFKIVPKYFNYFKLAILLTEILDLDFPAISTDRSFRSGLNVLFVFLNCFVHFEIQIVIRSYLTR